jgi:Tfp pilus assembly protein PilF
LLDKGFPEEARRQFQHCLNTNDLFVPAWEALAEAYQRLGQEERAQEARQTALKMRQALEWRLIEADARRQHPLWSAKPIDR